MGGVSNVVKAGMPKSFKPKDMLKFGTPKEDIKRQKNIWNATFKPQPYEGPDTGGRQGPILGSLSEDELEEIRRRRGGQRRPASTVLTAGGDGETLGG